VTLAERGQASAIVAVTRGGKTAALLSALRPAKTIVAATDQTAVFRRLALSWGVLPLMADLSGDIDVAAGRIGATLVAAGVVPAGSAIVLVSMSPELGSGPSNFVTLQKV
jgi:pyruvate kinase